MGIEDDWEMIQHNELNLPGTTNTTTTENNVPPKDGKGSIVDKAISLFETVATIPSISSARFVTEKDESNQTNEGVIRYEFLSSMRDMTRRNKRKWLYQGVYIPSANQNIVSSGQEYSEVGLTKVSPDGHLKAQTRTTADKKRFVEIVGGAPHLKSIDVTKVHGDFFSDDTFGSLEWSTDQSKLLYVAEELAPSEDAPDFTWTGDWGEGFSGKRRPVIVILDVLTQTATPLKLDVSVSKPLFSPDGNYIFFVGFDESPLKFGLRFCNNRRSSVYKIKVDGSNLERISPKGIHCRSPCLSPNGKQLLYLTNPLGGPHNSCAELRSIHLETQKETILVKVERNPTDANTFPGLYTDNLIRGAFSPSGDVTLIQSIYRSRDVIWAIHLSSGVPTLLTPEKEFSWSLLDVRGEHILATKSTYNQPSKLLLGTLHSQNGIYSVTWAELPWLKHSEALKNILENMEVVVASLPSRSLNVEMTLISPKSVQGLPLTKNGKIPLLVIPHGGPHSTSTLAYSFFVAGFVSLGMHCLMVNYRGSLGFGQDNVEALVGKIGDLDIEDVHSAALWALKRPFTDPERVGLFGGSHGGFITAHLLGRYPDIYKLGSLRNPVINVGAMVANSDIPDWCFAEAGFSFDQSRPHLLIPKEYETAFAMSPASVAHAVKGAVLLLLGDKDRRVPHSEGLRWGQYLQGQGKNVKIMMYPDVGHGLDTFDAEKGSFVETLRLIDECFS